ncbi:hypothetical protein STENM223S_10415 [Streptomyces tendae]
MIFAVVALAVVGMGNSNISTGGNGKTPRPQSTVHYPIRFEGAPLSGHLGLDPRCRTRSGGSGDPATAAGAAAYPAA